MFSVKYQSLIIVGSLIFSLPGLVLLVIFLDLTQTVENIRKRLKTCFLLYSQHYWMLFCCVLRFFSSIYWFDVHLLHAKIFLLHLFDFVVF